MRNTKAMEQKLNVEKIKEFGRSSEHRYTFKLKSLGEEKDSNKYKLKHKTSKAKTRYSK